MVVPRPSRLQRIVNTIRLELFSNTAMMDMPVNAPVDDPNADTEWYAPDQGKIAPLLTLRRNDILRKHGVIPEKPPSPTPIIQEALVEARKQAHENRLEDKDLDELNDLEDEEDDAFLDHYRCAQPRTDMAWIGID